MLSQPTQVQIIRVEEKRFRVVPVLISGESNYAPKLNKDIQAIGERDDNDEDLGGWINCEDCVPDNSKIIEMEEEKDDMGQDPELKKFTHFINVPLNIKGFQDSMKELHLQISKSFGDKYKPFLISPDKAHLTMLMLKLDTEERVNRLGELQGDVQKIIKDAGSNLTLEIGNLEMFHQTNKKTGEKVARVVYAAPKENKGLKVIREIIHGITSLLVREKVLGKEDFSHMKYNDLTKKYEMDQLHITVLKNDNSKLKHNEIEKLVQEFKKFRWNEVKIERIEISDMRQFEENGYYKALHKFNL